MNKGIVAKFISALFYIVFIFFLFVYIKNLDFDKLRTVRISYSYLFFAIILGFLNRFFNSFVWLKILENLGARIDNYLFLNYIYAKSWLGRYIPGKVTWIVGKIYFATKHGVSKKKLGVSSFFEGILQVLAALLYGSILLSITNGFNTLSHELRIFLIIFCLVICIVLVPSIFNGIIKFVYWVLKKKKLEEEHLINWKIILRALLYFIISMTIGGISYFLINLSIYQIPISRLPYYIGAINLAGAIGIASLIAPSGIGVKEGVQIFFLNQIMPKEIVLVVTLFSRLWAIIMDLLFFGVSYILTKRQ